MPHDVNQEHQGWEYTESRLMQARRAGWHFQVTPLNLLLLLCGLVINGLRAAQKAKENDTKFSFKFFVKDNWITIALTMITGFVSLVMAPDVMKSLEVTANEDSAFYSIHALISGIIPAYLLDELIKPYKKGKQN